MGIHDHNKFGNLDTILKGPREKRFYDNFREQHFANNAHKPIGTTSDFRTGGMGNVRLPDPVLQERYDFSGHRNSSPHVNYEVPGMKPDVLGDSHHVPLNGFDNNDNMQFGNNNIDDAHAPRLSSADRALMNWQNQEDTYLRLNKYQDI